MIAQPQMPLMTPQEYLEWEEKQSGKYGYIAGDVYAMTGGTIPHNDIALNLAAAFKNHLRGKGCKVQIADAKVGISTNGPFHYPDVMVSCNSQDQKAKKVIYHPCLIVEVISPGTEAFDRGRKFQNYRQIDDLQEYVLIETDKVGIEFYRLNEKNKWELTSYSLQEETDNQAELLVEFTSINFSCPISLIYENVVFS